MEDVDVVVVMLVNPGHGGRKYAGAALEKIAEIRAMYAGSDLPLPHIEVDGGVSAASAGEFVAAGANVLVVGGEVFTSGEPEAVVRGLLRLGA